MTLKNILENGYGIKFDTLNFETTEGACTKEEILESLSENELVLDTRNVLDNIEGYDLIDIADFDICDDEKQTLLFWD